MRNSAKLLFIVLTISAFILQGCLMAGRQVAKKLEGSDQNQQVQSTDTYTD